jgi:dUTP pyrophosphatase
MTTAHWTTHHADAKPPTRAYPGDAGFDLAAVDNVEIAGFDHLDIHLGVAIQWPKGMWGFLTGRSSTFRSLGLLVHPAVIDGGFRGELFALVRNMTPDPVRVEAGQRIAQIIPFPVLADGMEMWEVDELSPSERGTNGFGSTGH